MYPILPLMTHPFADKNRKKGNYRGKVKNKGNKPHEAFI